MDRQIIYEYLYNDQQGEASFKLGDHHKSDISIKVNKKSMTAGFKGETPIISGTLFSEVDPDLSLWDCDVSKGIVTIHFEKVKEEVWPVLICPKDFHSETFTFPGDFDSMDFDSIFKWGTAWLQTVDPVQGFEIIKQASDAGHRDALFNIAFLQLSGQGGPYNVAPSTEEAKQNLLFIADTYKDTKAYSVLAEIELEFQEYDNAMEWYRKSADTGDINSTLQLANLYMTYKQDDAQALVLLDSISTVSAPASLTIASKLYEDKQYERCIQYYERAISIDPNIDASNFKSLTDIKAEYQQLLDQEREEKEKLREKIEKKKKQKEKLKQKKIAKAKAVEESSSGFGTVPKVLALTGILFLGALAVKKLVLEKQD
eukprot:TRINITY_DN5498_c0_g2_i1.p1 TRINITY_DN5498_c0_g2~~TRINITY_DN5498_c0_g2_i1.p1  ORF type:complete len:372 (+),score=101.78 TRINITY_DN5498_c0_g2_i1:55-1170(+)